MAPLPLRSIRSSVAPFFATSVLALTACGGGSSPGPFVLPTYTISVSPQPASIPVNGTVTFTATTNDPSPHVTWVLVNQGNNIDLGSPSNQSGSTYTYTAPPTPPIFQPIGTTPPGSVTIRAIDAANSLDFTVAITAPSITTGFNSTLNTVALGKTMNVWAYAVGSTNNAITMQVNGTTGGSSTYGTIASVTNGFYGEYTYTAPSTMPMAGNTVTITVISQADPTKTSSMTVTLTTT